MDEVLFNKYRDLIYSKTGITLSEKKNSLLTSRIAKRLRVLNVNNEEDYYDYLTQSKNTDEIIKFIDVISTNVTSFFREPDHFDLLEDLLDIYLSRNDGFPKIWCAASSSGEEPYSLAMTVANKFGDSGKSIQILATDISTEILEKASLGIYHEDQMSGVSDVYRKTYFDQLSSGVSISSYKVKEFLRDMVVFRRLNLSVTPLPLQGPLDIIFCRNVMIYFDDVVRQALVSNMFDLLKEGGVLVISHTESLVSLKSKFKIMAPSVYVKPRNA